MALGIGAAIFGGSLASGLLGKKSADKQAKISRQQFAQTRSDLEPYRTAGVNALNQYQDQLGGYNQNLPQYTDPTNLPEYNSLGGFNFDLEGDPGYQFALSEAMNQTNRAQAGLGNFNSGNRLAALNDRAAGVASQYANDAFNRQFQQSQANYGRNLTDFGIASGQEQDLYNRNLTGFGIASGQEQDLYGRNQNYLNQLQGLTGSGQNAAAQTGAFGAQAAGQQIGAERFGAGSINNALQGGMSNYYGNQQFNTMMDRMYPPKV